MGKILLAYGLPPAAPRSQAGSPRPARSPSRGRSTPARIEQGDRLRSRIGKRLAAGSTPRSARSAHSRRAHPDQVRVTPSVCPLRGRVRARRLLRHAAAAPSPGARVPPRRRPRGTGRHPHPRHGRRRRRLRRPAPDPPQQTSWWRYGNLVIVRERRRLRHPLRARRPRSRCGRASGCSGATCWPPWATPAGVTSPHVHYEVRRRDADGHVPSGRSA